MTHTLSVCETCSGINKVSIEQAKARRPVCGKCGRPLPMHGLVSEVSEAGFRKLLRVSDHPLVVDFWASWCGPCKIYEPQFERASQENPGFVFLKVNTEANQQLAHELQIRGIPSTLLFRNGKEVKRQSGAMEASEIKSFLNSF